MQDEKNTALSMIEKERRGLTVRVGHSVLVQSEDGIALSSPVIVVGASAEFAPPQGGATMLGRSGTIQTGTLYVDGEFKTERGG